MSEFCPTPVRNADQAPHPVSSPAPPSAAEPTDSSRCKHETAPGLAAQLRGPLSQTSGENPPRDRSFDACATDAALLSIEQLLDAMEIIHGTFHEAYTLEDARKCLGALEPVIAMTIAETAKLRATLFPGGPGHVDN